VTKDENVREARTKTDVLSKLPLAVDLDGSLVRCDLFVESLLRLFFSKPWKAPLVAVWLLRGRAYAKARLAKDFPPNPADLPYDERLLDWLRSERAEGRVGQPTGRRLRGIYLGQRTHPRRQQHRETHGGHALEKRLVTQFSRRHLPGGDPNATQQFERIIGE